MADAKNAATLQPFDASSYHVGIAVGMFNGHITEPMKKLAIETLTNDYKIPEEQIHVVPVAGAADMPAVLEALARSEKIDCLIALAVVIRGETAHFDFVAKIITEAVKEVQLKHAKAVAFGVATVDTGAQAQARIDHARGYAAAALHTARGLKGLSLY